MGREELPRSEEIGWGEVETFLSNGAWSLFFLRHYV
jgi:hypothetical protein